MSARAAVERFLAADPRADRPEAWIHLIDEERLRAEAGAVDASVARGAALPLAGRLVAVKDNIDVAGCPTTAGAPTYAYVPSADATAVARLRAAGAIMVGKTNLDQFATGLVGTRSPYGAVRHAVDPERVSGGSSAGSAVAVALGLVDFALGTDTAGSGRVPAALHGLWGLKPTRGTIPTTGVVPACASLDCVTVFAADAELAALALRVMEGADGVDPLASRPRRPNPVQGRSRGRLIVPVPDQLTGMAAGWDGRFAAVVESARRVGFEVVERSIAPALEAAAMLYESSFVAERYSAVGEHIAAHRARVGHELDPTVAGIILAGQDFTASDLYRDLRLLEAHRADCRELLGDAIGMLTPTTTWHPTLAQVAEAPVVANSRMGRFTNFANLLDLAAVAFPGGTVDGLPFGAMITGHAFTDDALRNAAVMIAGAVRDPEGASAPTVPESADPAEIEVFVVGAHRSGQPLNGQLASRGAVRVRTASTAAHYRLYALGTTPPKPGMVRDDGGAGEIAGELWRISVAGFGAFVNEVPAPLTIGTVQLDDGTLVKGFLCEPAATVDAEEITRWGDWVAWLASREASANTKPDSNTTHESL
ncbi:allophanate hydrolase [Demequina aestuarii]|uniref:allophanate hydrolase n=1 Tax=Demequina aestuarii TaxID=327095 RepID=UPI0007828746|nr:allophanate hydrolase [Demequina aestuarii]